MAEGGQRENYRILLIGKTGNGKSALGNTMLGRQTFKSKGGMSATTKKCSIECGQIGEVGIEVMDTPGLTDPHHTDDFIFNEITKCLASLSPGPHAVFLVCSATHRFTPEEFEAYCKVKSLLGEDLASHMVIVFTGLDKLEEEHLKIEKQIFDGPQELRNMLNEVSNRYIIINNFVKKPEDKNRQLAILLTKVREVSPNGSTHLKSELLKEIDQVIQKCIAQVVKTQGKTKLEAQNEIKNMIMNNITYLSLREKVEEHSKKKNIKTCTIL